MSEDKKTEQFIPLMNEIIEKQAVILGPEIAKMKASKVAELVFNDYKVVGINGDPSRVLQKLIDEYVQLSGAIVENVLKPVFAKYPHLEIKK